MELIELLVLGALPQSPSSRGAAPWRAHCSVRRLVARAGRRSWATRVPHPAAPTSHSRAAARPSHLRAGSFLPPSAQRPEPGPLLPPPLSAAPDRPRAPVPSPQAPPPARPALPLARPQPPPLFGPHSPPPIGPPGSSQEV